MGQALAHRLSLAVTGNDHPAPAAVRDTLLAARRRVPHTCCEPRGSQGVSEQ